MPKSTCRFCLFGAGSGLTAAAAAAAAAGISRFRREKGVGWEINAAEHFTRIVACGRAFLCRNAEIVGRNQHLYVADDLYNGKQPNGHENTAAALCVKIAAEPFTDIIRNLITRAAAGTCIANPCREPYGIRYLADRFGQTLSDIGVRRIAAFCVCAGKPFDVAVAAK